MVSRVSQLLLSLLMSLVALVLTHGLSTLATPEQDSGLSATAILDRDLDPVIVEGVFSGVPVDQIFVYRETGGAWEQIPFQIDEVVDASGSYTVFEDGQMDANDEIVFMAKDMGDRATTSITATLPISSGWYEIEVSDPLSPAKKAWSYIVRSSVLAPTSSVNYVDYIAASQRISATNYSIGWSTSHAGFDYQSLFGSGNILDRTKVRIRYKPIIFPEQTLTEDDLASLVLPPVALIKDGPVRVLVSRGSAITFAYHSFVKSVTPIDLTSLITFGELRELRFSTDLNATAVGGIYYNENTPGGVTVDGSPDPVGTALSQPWRQVSLSSGAVIQVADAGPLGGSFSHYYKDNSSTDPNDTGDQKSYGDSGVTVLNPTSKIFTITSAQYMLPSTQNRGSEFYQFFQNPLLIASTYHIDGSNKINLPLILRGF